jgi:hypothetical protein
VVTGPPLGMFSIRMPSAQGLTLKSLPILTMWLPMKSASARLSGRP